MLILNKRKSNHQEEQSETESKDHEPTKPIVAKDSDREVED
jgi:hypothetical protein